MGKSTISMAIFNSYVKLPEGVIFWECPYVQTNPQFVFTWCSHDANDVCFQDFFEEKIEPRFVGSPF